MQALADLLSRFETLRRKLLLAIAVLSLLLAGYFVFAGERPGGRSLGALPPPRAIFAARSPGARTDGALYQSKPRLAAKTRARPPTSRPSPHERVLSAGRRRPLLFPEIASAGPLALIGPGDLPTFGLLTPSNAPAAAFSPAFDVPYDGFGGRVVVEPLEQGPAPGPGPDGPGAAPGPAVPEPATWAMMLAGIGFIGVALRRRRRPCIPACHLPRAPGP